MRTSGSAAHDSKRFLPRCMRGPIVRPSRSPEPPMRLAILCLAVTALAAPAPAPSLDPVVRRALEGIRPEALRAHMLFLADDRLEGRGTGTRGHEIAAAYMAAQLAGAGLEPGGPSGSWYQPIPFRRLEVVRPDCGMALVRGGHEQALAWDQHFIIGGNATRERTSFTAPLVYAGFGVTAPELGYDDYARVDARGKVVVLLFGGPKSFPNDQRASSSSTLVKARNAVARGAIGIITVRTPGDEMRAPWPRVVNQSRLPGMRWLEANGAPHDAHPEIQLTATMSRSGANALF